MVDFLFVNQPRLKGIPAPREIDCSNPQKDFHLPPLGLAYLCGAVRKAGKTCRIIDLSLLNKGYDYFVKVLEEEKPEFVLGGFTTSTMDIDMELAKVVKLNSNARYGTYGPLASSLASYAFDKWVELDFIIDNEPELTIEEIAKGLDFSKIKGLSYRVNGKCKKNPYRTLLKNLDKLPLPAFDLVDISKYSVPYLRKKPFMILRTARGCIAKCTYCITGGLDDYQKGYGNVWRAYSVERTLEEVELLIKKYNVKEIWFFDDEFTIDKKRVREICREIIKRKLKFMWLCKSRVDNVDFETLKLMKQAGCYGIGYGVEAANENVIKRCKKNITKAQVESAVILSKAVGIRAGLFFMIGLPGETEETMQETIDFAKHLTKKYSVRGQCTIATPYPGTKFYNEAIRENWIKGGFHTLEQTTASVEYPNLSRETLEKYHKKFYKEVVLSPSRIFKRVLAIRHPQEVKNLFLHLKEFSIGMLTKTRYVR